MLVAGAVGTVTLVSNTVSGIYKVLTDLGKLLIAKRSLRGERISTTETQFGEGVVLLLLPTGPLELTKEQHELLLSRRVDAQLSKLVSPLRVGHVDTLELRQNGRELARINAPERDFFDYVEVKEDKVREGTSIEGTLNSLSKNNMRGTFYTKDGVHVPYHYAGGDLNQLFNGFAARESVRVHGKVKFGTDGVPSFIEVQSIEPLQSSFFV